MPRSWRHWPIRPCVRGSPISGRRIPPREQQTPEALGAFHKAEIEKWWPIIKAAGIKARMRIGYGAREHPLMRHRRNGTTSDQCLFR